MVQVMQGKRLQVLSRKDMDNLKIEIIYGLEGFEKAKENRYRILFRNNVFHENLNGTVLIKLPIILSSTYKNFH